MLRIKRLNFLFIGSVFLHTHMTQNLNKNDNFQVHVRKQCVDSWCFCEAINTVGILLTCGSLATLSAEMLLMFYLGTSKRTTVYSPNIHLL